MSPTRPTHTHTQTYKTHIKRIVSAGVRTHQRAIVTKDYAHISKDGDRERKDNARGGGSIVISIEEGEWKAGFICILYA